MSYEISVVLVVTKVDDDFFFCLNPSLFAAAHRAHFSASHPVFSIACLCIPDLSCFAEFNDWANERTQFKLGQILIVLFR